MCGKKTEKVEGKRSGRKTEKVESKRSGRKTEKLEGKSSYGMRLPLHTQYIHVHVLIHVYMAEAMKGWEGGREGWNLEKNRVVEMGKVIGQNGETNRSSGIETKRRENRTRQVNY